MSTSVRVDVNNLMEDIFQTQWTTFSTSKNFLNTNFRGGANHLTMTEGEHIVMGLHDFDGRWHPPWWKPPKAEIAQKKTIMRESLLSKMASVHSTLAVTPSKTVVPATEADTDFNVLLYIGWHAAWRLCWQWWLLLSRNRGRLVSCVTSPVVGMCSWWEHPLRKRQQESCFHNCAMAWIWWACTFIL
jgi:hypothetical protein